MNPRISREFPVGYKWVNCFPFVVAILIISIFSQIVSEDNGMNLLLGIYLVMFNMLITPDILRAIICQNWVAIEANVESMKDLSKPIYHIRGFSFRFHFESEISYYYDDENKYKQTVRTNDALIGDFYIYVNPNNPSEFTLNNKINYYDHLFFLLIGLLIIIERLFFYLI